ncbi:glycoside hydrolase family 75 protein [Streptomyces sp. NPDC002133]|uniref:glycoside hydrolase family 75 protein n=1 Tax=Streptomyces sp. NPDC002133 TaxID=3154409 RepID=UPI0033337562
MPHRSKAVAATCAALLAATVLPASASASTRAYYEGSVSAAELLAQVGDCDRISDGRYRIDADEPADVPVCGTSDAVFWKADMDIDCDGWPTEECNSDTDPYFQDATAVLDSEGDPLSSEFIPFIVVPTPSSRWDYRDSGIRAGSVAAVIYRGRVVYAVVGDVGPSKIIGEASWATADALGIDPDPQTGGVNSGVTYIVFRDSQVSPVESHSAAVALGNRLARDFVGR